MLASAMLFLLPAGCATAPAGNPAVAELGPPLDLAANAYEPNRLDRQPRPRMQTRPIYPFEMRRAGIAGQAVVEFIVDRAGNVQQARAVAATNEEFARAAVQSVAEWKFSPGMKDGRPVDTIMRTPITFGLGQ